MGEEVLVESVRDIAREIEAIPAINTAGLKNTMHPDDLILSLHNHLGNTYQLIHSGHEAVNGAEQFLAYKNAQKELDELSKNLFSAQQTGLISQHEHDSMQVKIRGLVDHISDSTDPEYA